MFRIALGTALVILFFLGILGATLAKDRAPGDLQAAALGGTVVCLAPGVALIAFGIRARRRSGTARRLSDLEKSVEARLARSPAVPLSAEGTGTGGTDRQCYLCNRTIASGTGFLMQGQAPDWMKAFPGFVGTSSKFGVSCERASDGNPLVLWFWMCGCDSSRVSEQGRRNAHEFWRMRKPPIASPL